MPGVGRRQVVAASEAVQVARRHLLQAGLAAVEAAHGRSIGRTLVQVHIPWDDPAPRTGLCADTAGSRDRPRPLQHAHRRPRRPAQRGHRRPRRPRQDHARGRDAAPDRRVPLQPGRRGPGHGFGRPRAREGHHDPGQADDGRSRRDPAEHRRHARPRRLRRRGRAQPADGRFGAAPRGRRRGAAAADALRPPEGDGPPPAGRRGAQQDRSRRRPPGRGPRRRLRAVHGPRRRRAPDRVPGRVHERQARDVHPRPGRARDGPRRPAGPPDRGHAAGQLHAGPSAPAARHEPVRERVRRPDGRRPHLERPDPDGPAHRRRARGGRRHVRSRRAGPDRDAERHGHQPADRARHRPRRHRGSRTRRHRVGRRPARGHDRRHAHRSRPTRDRCRAWTWTRRRCG